MVIDLSHIIQDGIPSYPGDTETVLLQSKFIRKDYYNNYKEDYEHLIQEGQIVVLYTVYSKFFEQPHYFTDHPVLTMAFAELLVRKRVKMIGLDTPSSDKYPFEVHKYLFKNKILIAENLTNSVFYGAIFLYKQETGCY